MKVSREMFPQGLTLESQACMVTYMNNDTATQYELWLSALEASHAEGAHGSDPSRYWRKAGCPSCLAADAEAEAYMARVAADAARLRARRLKAYEARQAREPYPLSRKRSA